MSKTHKVFKIFSLVLVELVLIFVFKLLAPTSSFAISHDASPKYRDENTAKVTITFTGINQPKVYVCLKNDGKCGYYSLLWPENPGEIEKTVVNNSISIDVCGDGDNLKEGACGANDFFNAGKYNVWIYPNQDMNDHCETKRFPPGGLACFNPDDSLDQIEFNVNHYYPIPTITPAKPSPNQDFTFKLEGLRRPESDGSRNDYDFKLTDDRNNTVNNEENWTIHPSPGFFEKTYNIAEGTYNLRIKEHDGSFVFYDIKINISSTTAGSVEITVDPNNKDENEVVTIGGKVIISHGAGNNPCSSGECCTALGCIPTTVKGFTEKILAIATGIAGGIALILMVIGSIRVLASSGDPKAVGAGREMIVAAVAGLLFLIFGVLILRFIGINILGGVLGMGP